MTETDTIPTQTGEEKATRDIRPNDSGEFHTQKDLPHMSCGDLFFGCGPLLCLITIVIFAIVVMSIPESEKWYETGQPTTTVSPTMAELTTTAMMDITTTDTAV